MKNLCQIQLHIKWDKGYKIVPCVYLWLNPQCSALHKVKFPMKWRVGLRQLVHHHSVSSPRQKSAATADGRAARQSWSCASLSAVQPGTEAWYGLVFSRRHDAPHSGSHGSDHNRRRPFCNGATSHWAEKIKMSWFDNTQGVNMGWFCSNPIFRQ